MRYSASEKAEIIRLVEQSHLSAKRTLDKLGIPRATFYRWYDRYRTGGPEALDDHRSQPDRVWNRIPENVRHQIINLALEVPELSPRELAVRFTDEKKYFVSEASVYRLLKAHDLITSPAYVVIKAADEFKDKTTAINQLWQTDFTYLKITGWGWYYLSTVLDDFSRYIVAWKLCATMCADDVTATLDLASWPRALITSPSCTGQDFSQTMAHHTLLATWPSGSRTWAWSTCAGHRIIPKLRERSSAGTRP
jgi:putative transposase